MATKTIKKAPKKTLAQYGFGTGLSNQVFQAGSGYLLNSATQGLNTIFGGGSHTTSDGQMFNYNEGGQIFALGGITGIDNFNTSDDGGGKKPISNTSAPLVVDDNVKHAWNDFQGYLAAKKYAGSDALNSDSTLGLNYLNEYKKINPTSPLTPDYIKPIQQSLNDYRTQQWNNIQTEQQRAKKTGTVPTLQTDATSIDHFMPNLSSTDGWLGSKTSQARFPDAIVNSRIIGLADANKYVQPPKMAMGGVTGIQPNAEVEGNEVAQLPSGQTRQFQGPSHENGGIPVSLPQGTKVYSDRLAVDGKTMQQRKLARERNVNKFDKIVENNPTDTINRNTLNRVKNFADMQEQQDLGMQEAANQIYNKIPQLQNPGDPTDPQSQYTEQQGHLQDLGQVQNPGAGVGIPPQQGGQPQFAMGTGDGGVNPITIGGTNTPTAADIASYGTSNTWGHYGNQNGSTYQPVDDYSHFLAGIMPGGPATLNLKTFNPQLNRIDNTELSQTVDPITRQPSTDMSYSLGDKTGFIGNLINGVSPLATTIANRAGDKPNVNAFQNFGVNAVNDNAKAMSMIGSLTNKNLNDIQTNTTGQRMRNRNSATGVSTSRALDLSTSAQQNQADNNVYATQIQQMAGMYNEASKLHNQQDLYHDTGAQTADRSDRMDRDSYFSNLGQNFGNLGSTLQRTGKETNEHDYNNQVLSLLPELSKYGLGYTYDETGKPVLSKIKS